MRVLLDACVLYPTVMREVLLGTAAERLFTPLWSDRILEEWARAARKIGPEGETIARGEIALVKSAWPDADVAADPAVAARLWLPDPNDIHVLSSAITGRADCLLTLNAKDFPTRTLRAEGIERRAPDDLLMALWQADPQSVARAVRKVHQMAEHLSGHPWPLRKLLKKAQLPRLAKALSAALT